MFVVEPITRHHSNIFFVRRGRFFSKHGRPCLGFKGHQRGQEVEEGPGSCCIWEGVRRRWVETTLFLANFLQDTLVEKWFALAGCLWNPLMRLIFDEKPTPLDLAENRTVSRKWPQDKDKKVSQEMMDSMVVNTTMIVLHHSFPCVLAENTKAFSIFVVSKHASHENEAALV